MAIDYSNHANQVRAADGPLERMVPRDEDPTEKSLLALIEERAGRAASVAPTDADESRAGRNSVLDQTDEAEDQPGLDRTMMRLGGNGF
jgi:hypothetical protein